MIEDLPELEPYRSFLAHLRETEPQRAELIIQLIGSQRARAKDLASASLVLRKTLAAFALDVARLRGMDEHLREAVAALPPSSPGDRDKVAELCAELLARAADLPQDERKRTKEMLREHRATRASGDGPWRGEVGKDVVTLQDAITSADHEIATSL